jgi:putative autoinducer-2 (AI-2) aldolase
MDWGLENRLARIFDPKDGRTVMLAVDHGYFLGPTSGLEQPYETVKPLLPYADTLMLTRGVLRSCIPTSEQTLQNMASLIDEGNALGIPVLAVTAVGKNMGRNARYLGLASRIASEMGAHFVKTYYCDDFEKVAGTCTVPTVIAGGKKIPEMDAINMAYNAIQAGACGVDMGRNIFQSDSPVGMIQAVRSVIHGNAKPNEAYDIYETIKNEG